MTTHDHDHDDHDHDHQSPAVKEMREACVKFVDSLSADQKSKTLFHFNDGERVFWYYPPMNRHGLPLRDMDENQRTLAYALMASGLSESANSRAHLIIEHETILGPMEKAAGIRSFVRDPELYYWTVFGDPLGSDPWGWRIEGHHISIHMHIYRDEVISTTPFFFGSNPAIVPAGFPHAGRNILGDRETMALELATTLDSSQRSKAVIAEDAPFDILTYNSSKALIPKEEGIRGGQMNGTQKEMLTSLITEYTSQVRDDIADKGVGKVLNQISEDGVENFHLAWSGGMEHGQNHYYRIHSGDFVIEYDNRQNDANHIHSVLRDVENDFGIDVLREHLLLFHVI
ncbi:MAG: DUF3500 domain-containing protein [Chloroflexi bacterium]|nr:DUF3500 domain-containing protein [Chloroflexota bacterium]